MVLLLECAAISQAGGKSQVSLLMLDMELKDLEFTR